MMVHRGLLFLHAQVTEPDHAMHDSFVSLQEGMLAGIAREGYQRLLLTEVMFVTMVNKRSRETPSR
jgi:hypothetical protein